MRSALETVHRLTNTTPIDVDPSVSALRLNDIDRSNHGEHNYMKIKKISHSPSISFYVPLNTLTPPPTSPSKKIQHMAGYIAGSYRPFFQWRLTWKHGRRGTLQARAFSKK